MFDQMDDTGNVHAFHSDLLGDLRDAIAAFPETADLAEDVPIRWRPSGDVLDEAHEELILAGCLGDDRRYGCFAERQKRLDPTLAADKIEPLPVGTQLGTAYHRNWFFEADFPYVGDDH